MSLQRRFSFAFSPSYMEPAGRVTLALSFHVFPYLHHAHQLSPYPSLCTTTSPFFNLLLRHLWRSTAGSFVPLVALRLFPLYKHYPIYSLALPIPRYLLYSFVSIFSSRSSTHSHRSSLCFFVSASKHSHPRTGPIESTFYAKRSLPRRFETSGTAFRVI